MNKKLRRLSLSSFFLSFILAFQISLLALTQDDLQKFPFCEYCGMDRAKFSFSRMLIRYSDGSNVGTCSLHCAVMDLALKIDKSHRQIEVGDLNKRLLIDAEECYWVIGGDRSGVMTKRAKWAFAENSNAKSFIAAHGGEIVDFETAVKAAFEDMFEDVMMIRKKRSERRLKVKEKETRDDSP